MSKLDVSISESENVRELTQVIVFEDIKEMNKLLATTGAQVQAMQMGVNDQGKEWFLVALRGLVKVDNGKVQ